MLPPPQTILILLSSPEPPHSFSSPTQTITVCPQFPCAPHPLMSPARFPLSCTSPVTIVSFSPTAHSPQTFVVIPSVFTLLCHSPAVLRLSSAPGISQCPQVPPDHPLPLQALSTPLPLGPPVPPAIPQHLQYPQTPTATCYVQPSLPQCPSPWVLWRHAQQPSNAHRVPRCHVPLQPGHLGACPG